MATIKASASKLRSSVAVDLKEFLAKASKFKKELYDIDVFIALPNADKARVELLCAEFSAKCSRLKPTQVDPTETPLIIAMLLVNNRRLRDLNDEWKAENDKLKAIVAKVEKLEGAQKEDAQCKAIALELKQITHSDKIGKKLFQVMPFPHVRPVKNSTTTSLEDIGLSPDSQFGKACVAFWNSYYKRNPQLANASLFAELQKNPDKMRSIWYDNRVGQHLIQDNAKKRTNFKHGLFRILKALRSSADFIYNDTTFDDFAAALLDVTLANQETTDAKYGMPINETQYEVLKGFLALAALLGQGDTKKKYILDDKVLTKLGEQRLNGKEISKEMTTGKEAVALLIAVKFVISELETNNKITAVIGHLCDDFKAEDWEAYQSKRRASKDREDANGDSTYKDWGFTVHEIQLYSSMFQKLKSFRELDSKREFAEKIAVFRYELPDAAKDLEEGSHEDTRGAKRQRFLASDPGVPLDMDDLNYFGITQV